MPPSNHSTTKPSLDSQHTPQGGANANRLNKTIHEPRHVRIVCIGAGASGLLLAYKLQRSFENYSLVCYEKNPEIGGTWYENQYPGCTCDIPSHTYTWSFEPYTKWPAVYAGSNEILDYFRHFCDKHHLRPFCKFEHEVVGAIWNETDNEWEVDVKLPSGDVSKHRCDFLINASGSLNAWKWPDIPGLQKFEGKLMHSARWDKEYDISGKHIGLIGNGSSAIQILPTILPQAAKVTTFIRSPTWVAPLFGLTQHVYTPEEQEAFADDPATHLEYRKSQEKSTVSLFSAFTKGSELQVRVTDVMRKHMESTLESEGLREKIIPSFPVGCRRITPGTGYLEALNSSKVRVVHGSVSQVNETGCIVKNASHEEEHHPLDVLICATGFDTSFRPRFPIIGLGGKDLGEEWKDEPKSYFGLAVDGFPNYFVFQGPASPVAGGSNLLSIEIQADYMLKVIDRFQTESSIGSFVPNSMAIAEFSEHTQTVMERMVWSSNCRSWYKNQNGTGKVVAIWPGSILHYREAMQEPRWEDWEITYRPEPGLEGQTAVNRYSYLGSGLSRTETDATADWTYYIKAKDDSPHLSREARRREVTRPKVHALLQQPSRGDEETSPIVKSPTLDKPTQSAPPKGDTPAVMDQSLITNSNKRKRSGDVSPTITKRRLAMDTSLGRQPIRRTSRP